ITASSGLTRDEIERMVKEGERHAAEDRQRKDEVEQRNQADTLAYQAEKTLRDLGDKVPATLRSQVDEKVKAVREALQGKSVDAIRRASDELNQVLQQVGAQAYQQQQQGGPTPPPGGDQAGGRDDGSTVDGEFREV
ncbi:MAG: Hsp70 family protein, partial [Chloroflexota bacterium]